MGLPACGGPCQAPATPAACCCWDSVLGSQTVHLCAACAGHFTFLDRLTFVQQSVCASGRASGPAVRGATADFAVTWARLCASLALAEVPAGERGVGGQDGGAVREEVEAVLERACQSRGLECAVRVAR